MKQILVFFIERNIRIMTTFIDFVNYKCIKLNSIQINTCIDSFLFICMKGQEQKNIQNNWCDKENILKITFYPTPILAYLVINLKQFLTSPVVLETAELLTNVTYHHHHHVVLVARISLTLSRHFFLSFIASGRSSGLHPVSTHSC